MGPLRKRFSGSPALSQKSAYAWKVKCDRCGEIIAGHVDLSNDLSMDYEGDREVYFVRKVLMGSGRCFQQIEVELKFDAQKQLLERHIRGGQFVE